MERMKLRWGNILRVGALLMPLLGGTIACAQTPPDGEKTAPQEGLAPLPKGPVEEIRVVDEAGKVLSTKPERLAIKIGEPLNGEDVASSIRTLYASGDYADIKAIATPQNGGVRLDFVVRKNLYINQVVIEGLKPPPSEATASGALQLSLGQTYRVGDLDDAVARLKDALQDDGLYQAKIAVEQHPHLDTQQLDVTVKVDPGPRVRLDKLELQNNTQYSDSELRKLFRLKSGSELTLARGQSAVARVRKFLEKKGHLSERVSLRRGEYNAANNT